MKTNIHPNWHDDTLVTCSCGNTFKTGSTEPAIKVDICSQCHPFFTGEMKFVDQQGRVEKFQAKQANAQKYSGKNKASKTNTQQAPQTLKEMLSTLKKQAETEDK